MVVIVQHDECFIERFALIKEAHRHVKCNFKQIRGQPKQILYPIPKIQNLMLNILALFNKSVLPSLFLTLLVPIIAMLGLSVMLLLPPSLLFLTPLPLFLLPLLPLPLLPQPLQLVLQLLFSIVVVGPGARCASLVVNWLLRTLKLTFVYQRLDREQRRQCGCDVLLKERGQVQRRK